VNIKMIVTDLDRTLLYPGEIVKRISDYSAKIFNRCRACGIKIVFATARPKRTVEPFCEIIPADALILHNGAVIYLGDTLHTSIGIEPEIRDNILHSIAHDFPEATLSTEIEDALYANFDVSQIWNTLPTIRTDFTNLPNKPSDKIIIGVSSLVDIAQFSKYIPDNLYIEMSSGDNVNLALIMNREATKWNAIQTAATHFGISTTEIVAFGDDYNDISMLHGCGIGVAVANAIDEAKAAANDVCDTNIHDGVAKWLEENIS